MSAKGPIAGFLVAVLLTMSSWSSACDLSCALTNRHAGCAAGQAAAVQNAAGSAAEPEMDMSHCMHDAGDTAQPPAEPSLYANPCAHDACRLIAVSTAAKNLAAHMQRSAAALALAVLAQPPIPSPNSRFTDRKYRPPKIVKASFLLLVLRI